MPVTLFQCPIPKAGYYCGFGCYYQQTMGGFLSAFAFLEKKREQIQEEACGIPSWVIHEGKFCTAELQEWYVISWR